MTSPGAPSQTFHGAFHYVFYTPADRYGVTVAFYRDVLQLPVQSGWDDPATSSYGTLFLASSTGIIEVMTESDTSPFRATLLQPEEEYRPPRGGFMLLEVPDVDMARISMRRNRGLRSFRSCIIGRGAFATLR